MFERKIYRKSALTRGRIGFCLQFPAFSSMTDLSSNILLGSKKSINCSASFQILFVTRKTFLKTQVFEKQAKGSEKKIYCLHFLVPSSLAISANNFWASHFFHTNTVQVLIYFLEHVKLCRKHNFTKKAKNSVKKTFGLLFLVSSKLSDFQELIYKRHRVFMRKMCKFQHHFCYA